MPLQVILYGQLTEIIGKSLTMTTVSDTDALREKLNKDYPELQCINYLIAVNKQIIQENVMLPEEGIVALLPPFSGG